MSQRSIEAARMFRDHMASMPHPTIERVEVLEPNPANWDWANAALVVHMKDGTRYGMEVCPFPLIPTMPTGTVRSVTEPQNPEG